MLFRSRESGEGAVDVVDLCCSFEAQLDEGVDRVAELGVVEFCPVAGDHTELLEPVDASFRGRGGEVDLAADLAC